MMRQENTYLLVHTKMSNQNGIPSPFWKPNEKEVSPETMKEFDRIVLSMHPLLDQLARLISEKKAGCFQLDGKSPYSGVVIEIYVHNPNNCPNKHGAVCGHEKIVGELLKEVSTNTQPTIPVANDLGIASPKHREELRRNIETLLRRLYPSVKDDNIMGMVYSPHTTASNELLRLFENVRERYLDEIFQAINTTFTEAWEKLNRQFPTK